MTSLHNNREITSEITSVGTLAISTLDLGDQACRAFYFMNLLTSLSPLHLKCTILLIITTFSYIRTLFVNIRHSHLLGITF